MTQKFKISLENIHFYAKIGLFKQERVVGNEFIISISVEYDASSFISDEISTTISYADLYEILKYHFSEETFLLESVALKIAKSIQTRWNTVDNISITITKTVAPISGIDGEAKINYYWER